MVSVEDLLWVRIDANGFVMVLMVDIAFDLFHFGLEKCGEWSLTLLVVDVA